MQYTFFNKKNFANIGLVKKVTVNMKNKVAVTRDSNLQPNKNKTEERQNLLGLGYQENDCAKRSL